MSESIVFEQTGRWAFLSGFLASFRRNSSSFERKPRFIQRVLRQSLACCFCVMCVRACVMCRAIDTNTTSGTLGSYNIKKKKYREINT